MTDDGFELLITDPGVADVYLDAEQDEVPWDVVADLDECRIQVVTDSFQPLADGARAAHLAASCAGVVSAGGGVGAGSLDGDVPVLRAADGHELESFVRRVLSSRRPVRSYAFVIGRLERDFWQARSAIRSAVERDAGMACLWADDGRHRTNVASIRERTRLLIKHARFVIADLTLGVESPERENPSRAHEIGLAVAYERPLMLCSQEPRRYPYFSIADMQMSFWASEDELAHLVSGWIDAHRDTLARRVLNHSLPSPRVSASVFEFDQAARYVGPNTP